VWQASALLHAEEVPMPGGEIEHVPERDVFAIAKPKQVTHSLKEAEMSKVLVKSAWGSDDPTKAAFPFLHANALAEAGHEVQIFLLGEAVSLLRTPVANAIVPVGWPPLSETLQTTMALGIRIHV
jgi:hypothetical protein